MNFEHIELVAKRNREREQAPGSKATFPTEAVGVDVISRQFIKWRSGERDQELMQRAQEIIEGLRGQDFIAADLEAVHKIYEGYFAAASRRLGYKAERGSMKRLTGKYKIEKNLEEENRRLKSLLDDMIKNERLLIEQLHELESRLSLPDNLEKLNIHELRVFAIQRDRRDLIQCSKREILKAFKA